MKMNMRRTVYQSVHKEETGSSGKEEGRAHAFVYVSSCKISHYIDDLYNMASSIFSQQQRHLPTDFMTAIKKSRLDNTTGAGSNIIYETHPKTRLEVNNFEEEENWKSNRLPGKNSEWKTVVPVSRAFHNCPCYRLNERDHRLTNSATSASAIAGAGTGRGGGWRTFMSSSSCCYSSDGCISGGSCNSQGSSILCANCGKSGHVYRSCNLPITSFGVICFRWTFNAQTGLRSPQYLMVQRKDSLCFVEFIRGRYDPHNKDYIMHLLRKMTRVEREHIRTMSFPDLWHGFWQTDQNRGYMREFQQAFAKFSTLRRGFYAPSSKNGAHGEKSKEEYVDLNLLMNSTTSQHDEREWGFPKGRRNINEKDIKCALREFREETGIDTQDVHVHTYVKPFEEVFTACNNVKYRHVYYIVQLKQDRDLDVDRADSDVILQGDKSQMREISRVRWLDEITVKQKINSDNKERREMFDKVNGMILNSQFLHALKLSWIVRSDATTLPDHSQSSYLMDNDQDNESSENDEKNEGASSSDVEEYGNRAKEK